MAISVNWATGVISVPKADTVLIGTDVLTGREIRTFDTETFRKDLRVLEESEDGRPGFPLTHSYDAETIIDGINFAAKIIMNLAYYTIEFEDGNYRVVLINTNNNIASGTVVNGVSIQPTNSAGLVGSEDLRSQSFLNATVYLNVASGSIGTAYPKGTPKDRSNNIVDSLIIANREGLRVINLIGFLNISNSINLSGFKLEGGSGSDNVLLLNGGNTSQSAFERLIIVGQLNGLARLTNCILGANGLGNLTGVQGRIVNCIINNSGGIIQEAGGAGTLFDNCSFISPNYPQITVNANGEGLGMRDCNGNVLITNYTKAETNELHFLAGTIEIDASCTDGTLIIDGHVNIINNSNGTTVIDATGLSASEKNEVLAYSKKASDNAEQVNNKI